VLKFAARILSCYMVRHAHLNKLAEHCWLVKQSFKNVHLNMLYVTFGARAKKHFSLKKFVFNEMKV